MEANLNIPAKNLTFFAPDTTESLELLFVGTIKAGFPSPADDFLETKIDMNKYMISHPSETFYAKVDGNSMQNAGIHDGDIMIIDRHKAIPAQDGKIYACYIDNEFTVKRVRIDSKTETVWLVPENDDYSPIEVTKENESFLIWGLVIGLVKKFK